MSEVISQGQNLRKAIKEGMDPQEAYIKYSVF